MAPTELVEFVSNSVAAMGYQRVETLRLRPYSSYAHFYLGMVHQYQNRPDEAKEHFARAEWLSGRYATW